MPCDRNYSEHDLVNLLKAGDEFAFQYLYDHYSGALFRTILEMVPDRGIAKDILQEVFINIWRRMHTYDSAKGRLFTWMYNIARHQCLDLIRSKAHRNRLKNQAIPETEHPGDQTLLTHPNTDGIGIYKLVRKLKPDYQILITMYYFEGYTVKQIMEMRKIPLGTVKTRIRLALVQLRNYCLNVTTG